MTGTNNLHITLELLAAFLSDKVEDNSALIENPRDYVSAQYSVDIVQQASVVENTPAEMHLCLPYYSGVEKLVPIGVDDVAMEKISGSGILNFLEDTGAFFSGNRSALPGK